MCSLYAVRLSQDEVEHLLAHCALIGRSCRDVANVYPNGEATLPILTTKE